jgi:hypothetical protein
MTEQKIMGRKKSTTGRWGAEMGRGKVGSKN